MHKRSFTVPSVCLLVCLLTLTLVPLAFSQRDDRAVGLQSDALTRIAKWRDHVRSTGDARSTISELSTAQAELNEALNRFLQVKDYPDAAWSAINLADILRSVNQFAEAIPIFKLADELAQKALRPDYETKALARMAFSEMSLKQLDAAAGHAQKAVSLGQDCGNPDFYFDALLTSAEVETTRGNLPAASDYVDRAFILTDQLHDKQQVYLVYGNRADIYYQKALNYDCQKQPDICLQSYDHAKADYQSAQSIAQKLGYTFLAQNYSQQLQTVEAQAAILKRKQGDAPAVPAWMFEPKQPKDVLATEIFATGAADPTTLALIKNAVAEIDNQNANCRRQGLLRRRPELHELFPPRRACGNERRRPNRPDTLSAGSSASGTGPAQAQR